MGIERQAKCGRYIEWTDTVRLKYVDGVACKFCHGPVIRSTWSTSRLTVCLYCETAAHITHADFILRLPLLVTVRFPEPVKIDTNPPPPPPKPVKYDLNKPEKIPDVIEVPVDFSEVKSARDVWEIFRKISPIPIPPFDKNPKLRRQLHRAVEAGMVDEYWRISQFGNDELITLKYPNQQTVGLVFGIRGREWTVRTFTEQNRRKWGLLFAQAYSVGAHSVLEAAVGKRLHLIKAELQRLTEALEPKLKPTKEVKQRWGSPVKVARQMVGRWFNR